MLAAALVATLVAGAVAQTTYPIGTQDFAFLNVPASINVGDSFNFDFSGGAHNAYSSASGCTADSNPVIALETDGPFTFTSAGTYRFICTKGSGYHCSQGMVASVNVMAAAAASSTTSSAPAAQMNSTSAPAVMTSTSASPSAPASATTASVATSTSSPASTTKSSAESLAGSALTAAVAGAVAVLFM